MLTLPLLPKRCKDSNKREILETDTSFIWVGTLLTFACLTVWEDIGTYGMINIEL